MRKRNLIWLVTCAALAAASMMTSRISGGQAPGPAAAAPVPTAAALVPPLPQMPPSLVPAQVVDLMTPEGSALFGAQWKSMEAKIVEGPAIANAMPGYKTSYDVQPHAGERGFDDSSWPVIGAKGLGSGLSTGLSQDVPKVGKGILERESRSFWAAVELGERDSITL